LPDGATLSRRVAARQSTIRGSSIGRCDRLLTGRLWVRVPPPELHEHIAEVTNRHALEERFGDWPSFHDAEVYAVRLDSGQLSDGLARLQLDVHVFATDGVLPDGRVDFVKHTLVKLEFDGVEALEMDGFGPQNVLDDLVLEDVESPGGRRVQVTLPSNNGLGGTFRCRSVTVLDVMPYEPTEHSVYRPHSD
jgi:Immunity protein 50